MRAIAAGVTDVGKERDHNEDRFVLLPEFEVFVVADGMGGHQCGEVASRMATSTIATYFRENRAQRAHGNGVIAEVLRQAVVSANERIHRRAMGSTVHRGMGTTVVAAAFSRLDEKLYVAHAGDSRAYLIREGRLEQLTRDHSLIEEALRTRPDISESELAYLPGNVITRALGVEPIVDVDVTIEKAQPGDMYLLCSDGLHGFVTDERIGEIIRGTSILTGACAQLIAEANRNGGGDNITAVLIRIEDLEDPWAVSTTIPPGPARASDPGDEDTLRGGVPMSEADPYEDTKRMYAKDVIDEVERAKKVRAMAADAAAEIESRGASARESIEADDTAQVMAISDPDAVLANAGADSDSGDADD
jgi:protein phosphatase